MVSFMNCTFRCFQNQKLKVNFVITVRVFKQFTIKRNHSQWIAKDIFIFTVCDEAHARDNPWLVITRHGEAFHEWEVVTLSRNGERLLKKKKT